MGGFSKIERKNVLVIREHGEDELAKVFERLDFFRQGRWYGGKGNGDVVRECLEIIEKVERWVQE